MSLSLDFGSMLYDEFKKVRHEPLEVLEAARLVDLGTFKIFMFKCCVNSMFISKIWLGSSDQNKRR